MMLLNGFSAAFSELCIDNSLGKKWSANEVQRGAGYLMSESCHLESCHPYQMSIMIRPSSSGHLHVYFTFHTTLVVWNVKWAWKCPPPDHYTEYAGTSPIYTVSSSEQATGDHLSIHSLDANLEIFYVILPFCIIAVAVSRNLEPAAHGGWSFGTNDVSKWVITKEMDILCRRCCCVLLNGSSYIFRSPFCYLRYQMILGRWQLKISFWCTLLLIFATNFFIFTVNLQIQALGLRGLPVHHNLVALNRSHFIWV